MRLIHRICMTHYNSADCCFEDFETTLKLQNKPIPIHEGSAEYIGTETGAVHDLSKPASVSLKDSGRINYMQVCD